ncbi:hypothetical protein N7541_011793 [Penicillium brevicompactum]|uniref:Uncharacterized protein n=1 Tax=Penicillium brevicompactum TaxID=5074 RepID=A0A9W9QNW1_PENBR|nr:uncharacterized protein N7506_008500 [Penicillium brevicompactum]KAJ5325398.1 hypothetical protein N7506_008500 [Penicillium brevicompactum]KAJ5339839.1 hypothetical protein N7452_006567 [Penicillium brevicompactum]KAJ5342669.1 hypothetical protein N7541_011793 [Penicillium brevicompactum]
MSSPVQIPQDIPRITQATSPTFDIVRCSRCQQSLSLSQSGSGAVQFGMNSYYCNRCASKVGFGG